MHYVSLALLAALLLSSSLQAQKNFTEMSLDRWAKLREVERYQLNIAEIKIETILPRLNKPFLGEQSDKWILKFYEFLSVQQASKLKQRFSDLPLIRLEDGCHVPALINDQPQAFLPGKLKTGFPTVRASICASDKNIR